MIIKPMVRNYMCFTAHPEGCEKNIVNEIEYLQQQEKIKNGPKKVLVIGASTGYGMASRIAATFGAGASTIGVFFERNAEEGRTASAGLYNSAAFEKHAQNAGYEAYHINGDAFSNEIKEKTIALIKEKFGKVDTVIYSIASPKRTNPYDWRNFASDIKKPIGKEYTTKTSIFLQAK